MTAAGAPLVVVDDLRVRLGRSPVQIVDGVSFEIHAGELLGLLGESGSGKTTVALSLLGHARRGLEFAGGRVLIDGEDVLVAGRRRLQELRGADVAYVPQDPTSALNPALRVGTQLAEVVRAHREVAQSRGLGDADTVIAQVVAEAGLDGIDGLMRAYPHQLSGGQQQRVALAMAFALRPKVIVFDEPTTGLDVTTQRHVLATVRQLCRTHHVAGVYVSHDLAVMAGLADRLMVLYAGKVAETGPTETVFGSPGHPYTAKLLRAIPSPDRPEALEGITGQPPRPAQRPAGCEFAPRCPLAVEACTRDPIPVVTLAPGHQVRCLRTELTTEAVARRPLDSGAGAAGPDRALLSVAGLSAGYGSVPVLSGVSLSVGPNDCVAVVGESGSGKTTLARCVVGLHRDWSGSIRLAGEDLGAGARHRTLRQLRSVQYVFQNPYTALNPRRTIGHIIEEPLAHFDPTVAPAERQERVAAVLSDVALGPDFARRYPDQLSGGERQRVAIARALLVSPELLVCDEITSALDVSVQATIVELLRRLQAERGLALLFITHNLALVRSFARSVVVLSKGRVVEAGAVADVFERPQDPYTVRLMEDAPKLSRVGAEGTAG